MPAETEIETARRYTWRPLTSARWGDLEALLGPHGGCWCMLYRLERAEWMAQRANGGAENRAALRALVERGEAPGILAYDGDVPVGWCAIAPRDEFPALDRSPLTRRRDAAPVWSIVCFYVARARRRRGVMSYLVRAAVEHVRERGGGVIEAYPRRDAGRFAPESGWVGLLPIFVAAGFVEVARPSSARAIVRREARPEPDIVQ